MIGTQPTGTLAGIHITAVAHEGLTVTIDGSPGRLAVLDEAGNVVAEGAQVAKEAQAVAVNLFRSVLQAQGHLRILSVPLQRVARASGPANETTAASDHA